MPTGKRSEHVSAIDGLRAISVLAVLLYHLNEAALPGGFVGVDVFFVISGFVVTRSLLSRPPSGFLPFVTGFYRRRALRILPALLTFLLVFALLSILLIPSGGLSSRNDQTGIAAVFGASNLVLWWFAGNYFAPVTIFNPFTHTWSLGVEEQFYLLFPPILFLLVAERQRGGGGAPAWRPLLILGGICLVSLAWCAVASFRTPKFAFYMLATRFWELGAGALAALVLSRFAPLRPSAAVSGLLFLALAGLGVAFARADPGRFPFPWALLPVIATVMLCSFVTLAPAGGLGRLLGCPPLALLGRLSYSIYLWHFGIIVLFRWTVGMDGLAVQAAAGALSLGLAFASYRLVEQPLRFSPRLARRPDGVILAGAAGAVLASALLVGAVLLSRPWLSFSVTHNAAIWSIEPRAVVEVAGCRVERREAQARGGTQISFVPVGCDPPRVLREIAVIGDSHAGAYQTMLQQQAGLERNQVTVYQAYGCRVFRFWDAPGTMPPACRRFLDGALAALALRLGAADVLFLPALRVPRFRDQWDAAIVENVRLDFAPTPADHAVAKAEIEDLAPLIDRGVAIVVEAPAPVFRAAPFRCADSFTMVNSYCTPGTTVGRAEIEARRGRAMAGIAGFSAEAPRISVWDPLPILCPAEICDAFRDGLPLFVDGDHQGPEGNRLLLPSFAAHLAAIP